MKIINWNIKGAASLGWNNCYKIGNQIVDKIMFQNADVIVLTEFVISFGIDYLLEKLDKQGYIWFITNQSAKNGILIAIKKELVNVKRMIDNSYYNNAVTSIHNDCNLLKVQIPMHDDKTLIIIGFRMETGGTKNLRELYDNSRVIFDKVLLANIQNCKNDDMFIICGDFNNASCKGCLNKMYNRSDYINKSTKTEYAQINYNLNIIKDKLEELGFTMADIDSNGNPIPTHKRYFPNDHIFVRNINFSHCNIVDVCDFSDHDILYVE